MTISVDQRRLALAFAFAIAIHEVLAGLVPAQVVPKPPPRETVARVQVVHVTVRPIPTPTPRPPTPPPLVVNHAHIVVPAKAVVVVHRAAGKAAPHETVHHNGAPRPKPPVLANARPIWDTPPPVGGEGAGAGTVADAGSTGTNGTTAGTGSGTNGNGTGAGGGNEPCGYVDFTDPHGSRYDPRTHGFWVDIQMSVHFPDGSTQSVMLDYPWYYESEAASPWSAQNAHNLSIPTRFQSPPPEKAAGEPALVQYVVKHSTAEGFTLLHDCPSTSPSPPA